jgi:aspartate/methionine/tyrosine aminotransferase
VDRRGGAPALRNDALGGLELIADSFLSVATPVQLALADLLERAVGVRDQIRERTRANLNLLREIGRRFDACQVLMVEGGWSAVIRIPAVRSEEQLVVELLQREGILVHPGYFFDFPREAFVVVSLLPEPHVFRDGTTRLLRFVTC